MELKDCQRTGLFREHSAITPLVYRARATIPVVEKLRAAGANVEATESDKVYCITLGQSMPKGIVAVHTNYPPHLSLRLTEEPPYPREFPDYWWQVDWTPCPVCGAPVIWYEAGYVPGYRICTQPPHHHCLAK